jgi:hypothetical protein
LIPLSRVKGVLTPFLLFIFVFLVYGYVVSVVIQPLSVSALKGYSIQPYYINQNPPTTSCSSPIVDTSTSQPIGTGGGFRLSNFCLRTPQFSSQTSIPSSNLILDFGITASSALDGSNVVTFNAPSGTIPSFTANFAPDLVIVMVSTRGTCSSNCITGTAGGQPVAFTQRPSSSSGTVTLYEFYGQTSAPETVSITVTPTGTARTVAIGFAIAGVDLSNPFDTNTAMNTGIGNNPSVLITPQTTGDFVLGLIGTDSNPTITTGAGYTLIQRGSNGGVTRVNGASEYKANA